MAAPEKWDRQTSKAIGQLLTNEIFDRETSDGFWLRRLQTSVLAGNGAAIVLLGSFMSKSNDPITTLQASSLYFLPFGIGVLFAIFIAVLGVEVESALSRKKLLELQIGGTAKEPMGDESFKALIGEVSEKSIKYKPTSGSWNTRLIRLAAKSAKKKKYMMYCFFVSAACFLWGGYWLLFGAPF